MKMTRQLFGKNVRLEITSTDKAEVIQWRDYFFNWGAIKIADGNDLDLTGTLDRQQPDELNGEFQISFAVRKERLIKAFEDSAEVNTDWEKVLGKKNREKKHLELHEQAIARFNSIPAAY